MSTAWTTPETGQPTGPMPPAVPAWSQMTINETELALAWARRVASAATPDSTIAEAMEALRDVLAMSVCVANRLVAADDEYEVSVVSGPDSIPIANLLGSRYAQDSFERVISGSYERAPGVHLIPADAPEWDDFDGEELIPDIEPSATAANPWLPGQELFIVLRDRAEHVLVVISLDAPLDGELPNDSRLVLAALVAHHAATSLEARIAEQANAQAHDEADALSGIVGSLEAGLSESALVERAIEGIRNVCGYHTVEAHLIASDGPALPAWPPRERRRTAGGTPWTLELDAELLIPSRQISKSYLVGHGELERVDWPLPASLDSGGRGRRGWHRKTLVIPIDLPSKERLGVVLANNPRDRLLPTLERVRRLEAFATQIGLMIGAGRSLERARVRAEIDPLTRLANRGRLYADIQKALATGTPVSVLFIDLDGFKGINDTFGHSAGDELLRHVARRLERTVRPHSLVSRLAGDEFVIACFGEEALQIASVMARTLDALREPFALSCGDVSIDASAGISESSPGTTVDGLIHDADIRMYRAKAEARAAT
jgi:diguanylate cyclase (GGDEF)-like protein